MGKITRTCELDRVDLKELLSSKCKYGPVWQKYFVLPEDKRLAVGTCAYPAGFTLREWPFYHDEMFYVLQGKAKVTTSSAPLYDKTEEFEVSEGNVYFMHRGAKATTEVLSEKPYVYLFMTVPSPDKL